MTRRKNKGAANAPPHIEVEVLEPRNNERVPPDMELVTCPTCEGSGMRGARRCHLCRKSKVWGMIWATK